MGSTLVQPKRSRKKLADLIDTERIFCAEYVANGMKAAEAARVAFPNARHSNIVAANVMKRPRVKQYLGRLLEVRLKESGLTTDRILRHLETALFLDPKEIFERDENGMFIVLDLDMIPKEIRQCIVKITTKTREDEEGCIETYFALEFMSKDKALELAMKYSGLLKDSGISLTQNNRVVINFDQLCNPDDNTVDVIESRIVSEESGGALEYNATVSASKTAGQKMADTDCTRSSSTDPESED